MYDSCYWLRESCDELEDGFPEKFNNNFINSLLMYEMFIINLRKFKQSLMDNLNESNHLFLGLTIRSSIQEYFEF